MNKENIICVMKNLLYMLLIITIKITISFYFDRYHRTGAVNAIIHLFGIR